MKLVFVIGFFPPFSVYNWIFNSQMLILSVVNTGNINSQLSSTLIFKDKITLQSI